MKINRPDLISELEAFALKGNGVVIGAPGIGKSYTLAELRENLKKSGHPSSDFTRRASGDSKQR